MTKIFVSQFLLQRRPGTGETYLLIHHLFMAEHKGQLQYITAPTGIAGYLRQGGSNLPCLFSS